MNIFDQDSPGAAFVALAAGAAMKYMAGFMFQRNRYTYVGRVGQIWVYPIKSFKGHSVQEADCTALGIKWNEFIDRHWTMSTAEGVALTQRQEPTMVLITPNIIGDQIQLTAPGMDPITFPANPPVTEKNKSRVTIKKVTVDSLDCGDEVADWLCQYFKRAGLRLHFSAPSLEKRDYSKVKRDWENPAKAGDMCAFSDNTGFMVLSNASLTDLNSRLEIPVPITNFRANIVVDDCEAYAEDSWSSLQIGEAQLRALDACTRCGVITVDQEKGVKDDKKEPLATLKTYRQRAPYGEKACFGMNYTSDKPGKIKVGDPIYAKLL